MIDRFDPLNPRCSSILHGGDYSPEQWLDHPDACREDMRLMKLARCNAMTVGVFSWSSLEPEEGCFRFEWLDRTMDMLAENGAYAVLATPSAAQPVWLSQAYPEVLRTGRDRVRREHGQRVNYCLTSPVYRRKVLRINEELATRYKDHPALIVWHLSNEYGGECHCDLCREAFRQWLRHRYADDLDEVNRRWWTEFWSHHYTDWSQITPPTPIGECRTHGANLDWKRFLTDQTIDFMLNEMVPLRRHTPQVPVTTNFMPYYGGLDYWRFAEHIDVMSWDCYPRWHADDASNADVASEAAFFHDIIRTMKAGRPFMMMESTPSVACGWEVLKLKRPGVHLLGSLLAVAHGSDTVQYFQWRKGRGGSEMHHGAVVDHVGHEGTRIFGEVAEVGKTLERLSGVVGTTVQPEAAVMLDWENRWAIEDMFALGKGLRKYRETCVAHHRPFWRMGVPTDGIDSLVDFGRYRLVVAPMLYMLRPGVAERLTRFVADGGTLVMTYWSGVVDENVLAITGGWPGGGLREVFGIWNEETDALYPGDRNRIVMVDGNQLGLSGQFEVRELAGLIHAEGASVLATYADDFYTGRPALTVHRYGEGRAYYIAARTDDAFLSAFYGRLTRILGLRRVLEADLPEGVTAQMRTDGRTEYVFLMNFAEVPRTVELGDADMGDVLEGGRVAGCIELPPRSLRVLQREASRVRP